MSTKPSRFGPETRAKILARVELGVAYTDAANAAGVKPNTAKSWLAKGRREDSGEYADFAGAIEEARQAARSRPEPMGPEEFRHELERSIRAGSVQAMKLWADLYHRREGESIDAESFIFQD